VVALVAHGYLVTRWLEPRAVPLDMADAGRTVTMEARAIVVPMPHTVRAAQAVQGTAAAERPDPPDTPDPPLARRVAQARLSSPAQPASPQQASAAPSGPPAGEPARERAAGNDASPFAAPTYPTAPPPPADLLFDIHRGETTGQARLSWRLEPDGQYALELQPVPAAGTDATTPPRGPAAALAPHWTSRGRLDPDGLAPERFAVARRGRERHAANFRRDVGIVSYAGPAQTWPLAAGAQDRLSWMVQIAAVLQADPALAAPGVRISMMVVGAHGDAGLWTFTVQEKVTLEGPGGEALPAWQLRRESGHAHDPQVQVWLAPDLHHLPLRVRLTLPRTGESTEMRLRALQAP